MKDLFSFRKLLLRKVKIDTLDQYLRACLPDVLYYK